MGREVVRLELLKLAYRHDRSTRDTVAVASELEEFIYASAPNSDTPDSESQAVKPKAKKNQKSENANPLD